MPTGIYSVDQLGERVGQGVTDPQYCTLNGVAKENPATSPFVVANEFICGRLALLIGLPIPPGVIVASESGDLAYVSLRFPESGERPPPAEVDEFMEDCPLVAAGIVAFDCWIGNTDRHAQNFAYARGLLEPMIFDHSHALLGEGTDFPDLATIQDEPRIAGELVSRVQSGSDLQYWADRIEGLPDGLVESSIEEAVSRDALTKDQGAETQAHLLHRQSRIIELLKKPGGATNVHWTLESNQ